MFILNDFIEWKRYVLRILLCSTVLKKINHNYVFCRRKPKLSLALFVNHETRDIDTRPYQVILYIVANLFSSPSYLWWPFFQKSHQHGKFITILTFKQKWP